MSKLSRREMLEGNIIRCLIKLTIPLIFLSLINTLYGVIDTYFVGKIGELEVGAVSAISPIANCASAFSEGLCAASMALISMAIGQGDEEKAKTLATHLVSLCLILGVSFCLLLNLLSDPILIWLEIPEDIYQSAKDYLLGIAFDFVPLFMLSIYQSIMQSHGDSKSGVICNTIAAIGNCLLDPLFIVRWNMGTFGAALATVISKTLVLPIIFYSLWKNKVLKFKGFKVDTTLLLQITKVAIPSSAGSFLSSFGFVLMGKEITKFGSLAISAYGIGGKISSIYYIFVNCWGSGLTTMVGASLGAKNAKRARKAYHYAMIIVGIVSLIFIPLGFISGRTSIRLFVKDISDQLTEMALEYAYYSIFTAFCMGWMNNFLGIFNGSGNTTISMILNTSRVWLFRLPLIKILNHYTTLGVTNIWIAMCLSNLIVCIIGECFYRFFAWDKKEMNFKLNRK